MIQTKHLLSAILFCSTLSLSAVDMNNTVEIIEKASEATEELKEDFLQLIDTKEPIINQENTSMPIDTTITPQEVIIVEENNSSKQESNTSTPIETNTTVEQNQTVIEESSIEEEEGSFKQGMIIFKSNFKEVCKMTGDEFAKNYTQEDWDGIYDDNEFEKVVYEICPDMKGKYDKKWTNHLYQFSLKYASDSDEIPEC